MKEYRLIRDVENLSYVYQVSLSDDYRYLRIYDFNLPPGYNYLNVSVLLELPRKYPEHPPGVGSSSLFLPLGLKFRNKKLKDYHPYDGPNNEWAWWCYERIDWDPCKDNLITFFEILRTDMTKPRTEGTFFDISSLHTSNLPDNIRKEHLSLIEDIDIDNFFYKKSFDEILNKDLTSPGHLDLSNFQSKDKSSRSMSDIYTDIVSEQVKRKWGAL